MQVYQIFKMLIKLKIDMQTTFWRIPPWMTVLYVLITISLAPHKTDQKKVHWTSISNSR